MVDEATSLRVSRGGSFNDTAPNARSSLRLNLTFDYRSGNIGVRLARPVLD